MFITEVWKLASWKWSPKIFIEFQNNYGLLISMFEFKWKTLFSFGETLISNSLILLNEMLIRHQCGNEVTVWLQNWLLRISWDFFFKSRLQDPLNSGVSVGLEISILNKFPKWFWLPRENGTNSQLLLSIAFQQLMLKNLPLPQCPVILPISSVPISHSTPSNTCKSPCPQHYFWDSLQHDCVLQTCERTLNLTKISFNLNSTSVKTELHWSWGEMA